MSDPTPILPDACELFAKLEYRLSTEDCTVEATVQDFEAYGKDCVRAFCDEVSRRYHAHTGDLPEVFFYRQVQCELGL